MRDRAVTTRAKKAAAAITLTVVAVLVATACADGNDALSSAQAVRSGSERPRAPRPASIDDSSPEGAVRGFIAAEAAEAHDLSYGLLSAKDRDRVGSIEDWRDRHAQLWPMVGGEIGDVDRDGDGATVEARVQFHPMLEESLGLVPARAESRWKVIQEGDRWRIDYGEVRLEPLYPDDSSAPDQVVAWAKARQACQPADQYEGGLVGFPALADQLCRRDGTISAGAPTPLDGGPDADRMIAAFGADVLDWARVVPLSGPGGVLRVVVAPIGDRWTVVGVLDPRPVR